MKKIMQNVILIMLIMYCSMFLVAQEPDPGSPSTEGSVVTTSITISGTVMENEIPVENACIEITGVEKVFTNSYGEYSIETTIHQFRIKASIPHKELSEVKDISLQNEETHLEVNFLFKPSTLTGFVFEEEYPISGAKVYIAGYPVVKTDNSGYFERTLQEGNYSVFAMTASGEFIGEQYIYVHPDQETASTFIFYPGTIEISVIKEDKPLAGVKIIAGRNSPKKTGDDGICHLKTAAGTIHIYIRGTRGKVLAEKDIIVTEGEEVRELFVIE